MSAGFLLSLFAALAVPPTDGVDPAAEVDAAIEAAGRALGEAGACGGRRQRAFYFALEDRFAAIHEEAAGLFGGRIEASPMPMADPRGRRPCGQGGSRTRLERAAEAVAAAEQRLEAAKQGMAEGLWLGSIVLCRERVTSAEIAPDLAGGIELALQLTPEAGSEIAALTAGRVGRTVPLRLDGGVIQEPVVREPLSDSILLGGLSPGEAQRAMRAAGKACGSGGPEGGDA